MIQIRRNVFETNSSSMHSIALMNDKKGKIISFAEANAEDPMIVEDGAIVIKNDEDLEFGWGFEIVDTFYGRLCYAIADYGVDGLDFVIQTVNELFPEITDIRLPLETYGDGLTAGYIDHQSMGTLSHYLKSANVTLGEYLVDKKVMIIIDNDNSCHFSEIVQSGIFNEKAITICKDDMDSYMEDMENTEN